jgi:hypothetical protein
MCLHGKYLSVGSRDIVIAVLPNDLHGSAQLHAADFSLLK